jgi:T5SS/PEP-CTERM-associated repeat protein
LRVTQRPGAESAPHFLKPASLGALAALAGAVAPLAFAGITFSGAVNPDPSSGTVNGTLFVGNTAPGTFAVDAGSPFTARTLSVGTGGTGNGTVTITGTASGQQTVINLIGPPDTATFNDPLEVGNWGTGLMTVSNGAIINGLSSANCVPLHCNTFVAQTAGSSGTLTLTGAGTTASLGGNFFVGNGQAFTQAANGFNFGTPGGTATGVVNVLNGAALNTYSATLAFIGQSAGNLGTEQAIAHVTVDGTNSVWTVTQNPNSGPNTAINLASATNSTATLDITHGGAVNMPGQTFGVSVGSNGSGTLSINTGGTLTTESLTVAAQAGSTGIVNIVGTNSGPQTVVTLNGPASASNGVNPLQVGNWGNGSMTVSGGATVNAAVGNANCAVTFCGSYVGNGAGSTGSLTLSDAGTTMNLGGPLIVGGAAVYTNPPNNFTFGTPGGTTNATLQVLNGATLNTYGATISQGPGGLNPTGTEHTNAHVIIDGAGSTWNVTSDPINPNNAQAFVSVASMANATATIDVTHGGQWIVTGSGSNPEPQINLTGGAAQTGGSSVVNVNGAGSAIVFNGDSGIIQVGRNGGTAQLNVGSGGQVYGNGANSLITMIVGRGGSNGTLTVDGAASAVTLSGVGTAAGGAAGIGAGMLIGRDTGAIGSVAVTNGASILMRDDGQNAAAGGVGMILGRDAGTSGSLTVSGPGSTVTIEQTGGGAARPGMTIGSSGNSAVQVTGGGTIEIRNVTQNANSGSAGITIANNAGSSGMLTVSGVGSSITIDQTGPSTNIPSIVVGRAGVGQMTVTDHATVAVNGPSERDFIVGNASGGNGTLTVSNGAQITASWFTTGNTGGAGTSTIDNASVVLNGIALNPGAPDLGALLRVGRGAGSTGTLNLVNGAQLSIDSSIDGAGISLAGTGVALGGNGTLNMSGASKIIFGGIDATPAASVSIGHSGVGLFTMTGGSTLTMPSDGSIVLGNTTTGSGTLSMSGGSSIQTGRMNVGQNGSGNVGMVGANLNIAGNLIVGDAGTATFAQNGGTNTIGGQFILGNQAAGNGNYQASNNASIALAGTSTTARAIIGNAGTGALTLAGGSTMTLAAGGSMIVGATATGNGTVLVDSTSSIQAGSLIGLGHDGTASTGGQGKLIVDGSVTATSLVIGANGCLAGNGVVHANVTMNGTTGNIGACPPSPPPPILPFAAAGRPGITPNGILNAGRSPGRLVIDGGFDFISGTIVLEVESDGHGGFLTDQIVFSDTAPIDLTNANIEFSFLDNTDPNAFEASGLWDLDTFFRTNTTPGFGTAFDQPISVALDESLDTLFADATFAAISSAYVLENFTFTPEGGVGSGFTAIPIASVPEPATWTLMLGALLLLHGARVRCIAALARRR